MYTVYVYPGPEHWHQPIEELTESFCTKAGARNYVKPIRRHDRRYKFWMVDEKTGNGEYI